jgi:hypothetical protein
MSDFLSKIENFLFDILGLVLPGIIFLIIIISPVLLFDSGKVPDKISSDSYTLSIIVTFFKILKSYFSTNLNISIIVVLISAYLLGHTIKVFSIIIYEILTAVFDKFLNRFVIHIYQSIKRLFNFLSVKLIGKPINQTILYKEYKTLSYPIKNTLSKVFTFNSPNYYKDNETMKVTCIDLINQRLNTSYPNEWYSVYKLSTVIQQQENIKSLSGFFLAKYNLYRSLAFIFIFTTIYYYLFFNAAAKYIPSELTKITNLLLISSVILWFTFHYKYKRYWTLCGNESLVSLYYFLNKKKLNDV